MISVAGKYRVFNPRLLPFIHPNIPSLHDLQIATNNHKFMKTILDTDDIMKKESGRVSSIQIYSILSNLYGSNTAFKLRKDANIIYSCETLILAIEYLIPFKPDDSVILEAIVSSNLSDRFTSSSFYLDFCKDYLREQHNLEVTSVMFRNGSSIQIVKHDEI